MKRNWLVALWVASLVGCGGMHGNGRVVTRELEPGSFTQATVGSGLEATVSVAPTPSLRVSVEENLLEYLEVQVADGRLEARVRPGVWVVPTRPVQITTTTPRLERVEASGGSTVDASGMSVDTFTVQASGGSRVQLRGSTRALEVAASGGSKVEGRDLMAQELQVEASGGSTMVATVTQSVRGELSGGSVLECHGQPAMRQVVTSGGSMVVYP